MSPGDFSALLDALQTALPRLNESQLSKVWVWVYAESMERSLNPALVIPMPTLPIDGLPEVMAA